MTLEEADIDLQFINELPGRKIFIRGNHDYWWKSVTKLNTIYENMYFIQNDFVPAEGFAVCGGRGWICPNDIKFTAHDQKIYEREEKRLRLSLQAAKRAKHERIIVIMHYPPTNENLEPSIFTHLFEEFKVEKFFTVIFMEKTLLISDYKEYIMALNTNWFPLTTSILSRFLFAKSLSYIKPWR